MKKITAILLSLILAFCFSTVAFATGEASVDANMGEDYSADIYSDGTEDMLAEIYGEDFASQLENGEINPSEIFEMFGLEKSTVFMTMLVMIAFLLFIPVLIVLIVFISKNNKLKSKIRNYELTYGVVYDKDVLKDMANIPPQNYNYNPQTFVPQYPVNNQSSANQDISAFSDALKKEVNNENENNGGNM